MHVPSILAAQYNQLMAQRGGLPYYLESTIRDRPSLRVSLAIPSSVPMTDLFRLLQNKVYVLGMLITLNLRKRDSASGTVKISYPSETGRKPVSLPVTPKSHADRLSLKLHPIIWTISHMTERVGYQ